MDRRNTSVVGALLVLAVLGFGYVFFRSATNKSDGESGTLMMGTTTQTTHASFDSVITAKHAYKNGEHLIAGEITLPTPCHLLEHTVTILPDESRATIAFSRSFAGGDCPGGETQAKFLVRFKSKPTTEIHATLDGAEVTLSLIEATSSEDIEKTEIYLKG